MDDKQAYQLGVDQALKEAGLAKQPEQEKTTAAPADGIPEVVKVAYQEGATAALRKHLGK